MQSWALYHGVTGIVNEIITAGTLPAEASALDLLFVLCFNFTTCGIPGIGKHGCSCKGTQKIVFIGGVSHGDVW
jgi:hypothetical protein